MKKKAYISPVAEILENSPEQLLTGSGFITEDGDVWVDDTGEGDASEGCSRGLDDWFDYFKTLLVLVMMTAGLTVQAQKVQPAGPAPDGKTHAMSISLKDGTTVSYTLSELSHVTYLPGIGIKVYQKDAMTSVDYLFSQMAYIEYLEDSNVNANAKAFSLDDFAEAWRLEYPHLSNNVSATGNATNSQIVVKKTNDYGITYSLEWDNAKVANRWTCYQLHEGNSLSAVKRKDDFKADPEVYVSPTLEDYKNSGFSRGHLCPSADRLCSQEQNKQTFYLTNMQPQYQNHNAGLWARLETLVRDYATNDNSTQSHCDTLYIVKAATIIDKVTIDNKEVDGVYPDIKCGNLLVPKYFYMALLHYNKETDTYHAVAFWTEHKNENQSVSNLGDYAISIDELEKRTGIDFFCNLPDVIENDVEAEADLDFWHLK